MHALKNALSPTRVVASVASALTLGIVTKPVVSELAKMSRAAGRAAGFDRARHTVRNQKPDSTVAPPEQERISGIRLSGIVMNVDFISTQLDQLAPGTNAYKEVKLLDATAQYYLRRSESAGASGQATELGYLRTAFRDFVKSANHGNWSSDLDSSFLTKLSTRIDMVEAQLNVLARST